MKHLPLISSFCSTPRRKLYMAIAAQMIASAGAYASPNGGTVVGGDGVIEQSGLDTTIIQNTDHLAIDWESFNIAVEERVQFIQPDADSVALNRILGNEASQIFGRLDANGHVILMNPNGVLFGEGASVNVGGLVASGLNINADDFMNGEYVLQAVDGKDGTVINKGIINAATGGNISLIGKQVDNQGLISAKLGAVTLAAGKEAVLTFDNQGLLGVRVSKEILQDELGVDASVTNSGDINAEGGQILMTGSVSQDIFSQAVNADGLNTKTSVVMHEDGSFTLGAGADVVNTGTISTSSETTDAGQIVVLGENVNSSGAILANSKTANAAGNIEIHSRDTTLLTDSSTTKATNDGTATGGQIKILGDRVGILDQSKIDTSGTNGGGDINIGGGFQGRQPQLRNATRTVIGKDTLIEANAIADGDGGDIIVWADETTSFTGEINVRGGELDGDGGFVEVSGKENLRFLGSVDRTAVRGGNGTLLLDPENVLIQSGDVAVDDVELGDLAILNSDGTDTFEISDAAISSALEQGDVIIQAANSISGGEVALIEVADASNANSLILEAGNLISFGGPTTPLIVRLGTGNIVFSSGISNPEGARLSGTMILETAGDIRLQSAGEIYLNGPVIVAGGSLYLYAGQYIGFGYGRSSGSALVEGDLFISTVDVGLSQTILLPSGVDYALPQISIAEPTAEYNGQIEFLGQASQAGTILTDFYIGGKTEIKSASSANLEFLHIGGVAGQESDIQINAAGDITLPYTMLGGVESPFGIESSYIQNIAAITTDGNIDSGQGTRISGNFSADAAGTINIGFLSLENSSERRSIDLTADSDINIEQLVNSGEVAVDINIRSNRRTEIASDILTYGGTFGAAFNDLVFSTGRVLDTTGASSLLRGDINLISQQDIVLPIIVSSGDLNVESTLGSVSFSGVLDVGGDTSLSAAEVVEFLGAGAGGSDIPASIISENGNVRLSARNVNMGSWDENHTPLDIGGSFTVNFEEFARIKGVVNVGAQVEISTQTGMLSLGWGSINTRGSFYANLAEGSYDGGLETDALMSINAGQIDIIGSELLLADVELNGDSAIGTGDINITMTGDGVFAYPSINRQRQITTGDLNIDLQTPGATTRFYGEESSAMYIDGTATISAVGDLIVPDLDVNGELSITSAQGGIVLTGSTFEDPQLPSLVSAEGNLTIRSGTDIFIPAGSSLNGGGTTTLNAAIDVIIDQTTLFSPKGDLSVSSGRDISLRYLDLNGSALFEAGRDFYLPEIQVSNPQGERDIAINVGGTLYQNYDVYTGGGNYIAVADRFEYEDGIVINTDFSSETQDALVGTGNVFIQSTSDQAKLILPEITTQKSCSDAGTCGHLDVLANDVSNKGKIEIHGDSIFDLSGNLEITSAPTLETGEIMNLENSFGGNLSVNANTAIVWATENLTLGEWNVIDVASLPTGELGYGYTIIGNERLNIGGLFVIAADYVELKNSDSRFGELFLTALATDIDYGSDLDIAGAYLQNIETQSRFKVGGDFTVMQDSEIVGGLMSNLPILEVEAAAPIIFDVAGNIQLLGERNRLSSIQILNARNVEIFNNGELTLDGVNAENLTLNILGDIEQTAALNILNSTNINASVGANINLLDPLNDFASLSVQSAGPEIINIADVNNISLADIDLNGASQGGALSVSAAAITQEENGRILLQDATRLNLQADYITLGANGTASVDIIGSTLNGVFTRDLNIQGVVRGGAGVAGTGVAGFYFNGSVEDNFFEVADGASITGDFISGSKIFLGDGNDTASFAGDVAILVEGGSGQDTFLIETPNLSIAQILGNEDQDILVGPDAPNVWNITGNGEGTLSDESAVVGFSGIESLRGGSQTDDFIVESPDVVVQLDGGDGLDSLSANLNDAIVNNQWIVDGVNSGSLNELVLFSSVENLIGNDGDDTVTFSEGAQIGDVSTGLGDDEFTLATDITAGLLDAGDGNDTLNLNGLNSIYTYLADRIGGDGNYTEINFEIENNEGGSKTIVGVDGYDAEWIIDGDGSVTVNALRGGTMETNRFSGVTRVEGASGDDTFILQGGYIADRIVGGQGGDDSLIANTGLANSWLIDGQNSGLVQVAESGREQLFEAITNLVGGADNDIFRILGGANFNGTIAGGLGTNSLEVFDSTATSIWTVASVNNLTISTSSGAASSVTFSDIQSLVGNDNEDVLDLSAVTGSVDLRSNWASGFVVQNFDAFVSSGGDFLGTDADTFWVLNDVSEIAFRDLNGVDQKYTFSGFRGIHGGSGEDYFRIDGRWSAVGGQIFAESLIGSPDTAELNVDSSSAWNFNSGDSTEVYLNVSSSALLFAGTRSEASSSLANIGNPFILLGIEKSIAGRADDIFLVYGDNGLFDPNVDGNEGNDYLVAYNWGTPQDLVWNVTEDNGGDINNAVRFQNFENLKSHDFSDTNRDGHGSRFNLADGVVIGSLVGDSTNTEYIVGSGTVVGSISDGGGVDSITALGSNSWLLTSAGGSLNSTTFSGIEILNGGAGADDFILSSATSEVTQINGGSGENSLTAFNQDNIWTLSESDSSLNEIQFNNVTNLVGNAGVDTFVIADTGLTFNIDGDGGVDELIGLDQLNSWLVDGTYSGTLNEAIVFTGVEHLQGGALADQFTVTDGSSVGQIAGGDGDDIIAIGTGASAIYIFGEAGSDLVQLGDLVNITGDLDGGAGDVDVLDISAFKGAFEFDFSTETTNTGLTYSNFEQEVLPVSGTSFFGGDGNTRWTFAEDNSFLIEKLDENGEVVKSGSYSNYNTVRGGVGVNAFVMSSDANFDGAIRGDASGNNSLTVADLVNLWIINGQNQGQLQVDGAEEVTLFSNIANLIGGASTDSFEIATGGSVTGSIDGGAGNDRLVITDAAANNKWVLATQNSVGVVVQFRGIEALVGNANDDSFAFVDQTDVTSIEGGNGENTVLWSAGDVAVNLGMQSINEAIVFSDITSFSADQENNNSLTGADQANTWILDSTDSGTVNSIAFSGFNQLQGGSDQDTLQATDADNRWHNLDATENTLNDLLIFSGMERLIGGAGADEFSAELIGVTAVDGGLGTNQLAAAGAADNEWSIDGSNSGSVNTTLVFEGIQNLVGNSGNDTFTFATNGSIGNINAGSGDDTFVLANNITAGILDGGDGFDILDRAGLNSIVTYLREVIGGDAVYTAANIETETSSGGSTTVVGVDGYSAEWRITGDGTLSVTATDTDGVAVTNEFIGVTRAEGGAGFDAFVLLEEGTIAEGVIGSGNDYLQASETTNIWTINAADGGELAVQEYGTRLLFQGIANLYGGNGSDLFDVTADGSVSGSIYGSGGVDTLVISGATAINDWQLGDINTVGLVANFHEIETLVGNSNNDTFTFSGLTSVTSIDGGVGDNAVIWRADDVAINLGTAQMNEAISFADIDSFDADSAFENTLIGADESNAWTLNSAASGTVANTLNTLAFSGFQNLMGGSGSDNFVFTADASGFTGLNGSTGEDTISAADQLNQWALDAEGGELNGLRFANVETLTGGALQDNFVLADATSQAQIIDGGAGANRLAGYDQVNAWNVTGDNAGDLTGLGNFSNIQTLVGGAQADTFTLAAGVNLSEIYAGAGNDLFVIGAGVVADNFYGEAGDDSVEVEVGLELSGVLDGGSGGETDGDYINLSKYTLLDATAELESLLGFAFLNFERIDEPNTQGVYFGGNGTNFWYITGANEGRLEIRDGEDAGVYEFSGVHSLLGGEGEDIFIFANDTAAVSTLIDGGEGAGANTLDLSAQGLINEWLLSGANSGLVSNASNTSGNIFTNIAYLIGGSSQDVFDLQAGGSIAGAIDGGLGGDELRVSVEQTSNWQLGDVAGHSVTGIASFTNIEGLTGGAGADNFDILAELADVTQLNGGAGSDAVNFLYEAPVKVDLANGVAAGLRVESVERFTAADARSIFTGVESAATWTVDGADQGSIQYQRPADGDLINVAFDGFGNLIGGAGGDQFVVAQGGSLSGTLSGGGGRNTVDLQDVVGDIHVTVSPDVTIANGLARMTLADVDQLIGNGRTWLYGASDRSYTWTIDGIRSGQMTSTLVDDSNRLLAFENLSAIRGGTHDDIFQVIAESPLLSLDGGSAVTADLVDYSLVNGNLRISLAGALTGQNGELTGVEGIRGNNSGPDSLHSAELAGPDSGAVWSIGSLAGDGLADGVNDGRVAFDGQTITFVDFNVLTGGAGVDTFNQAAGIVLGTLNGGPGDDVFNVDVMGANAGTAVVGGVGTDSLVLRGGDETGLMTYTAAAGGGEFDYRLADVHYKVSHQGVEGLRDRTLAATLDVRGSSAAETFSLANDRFWVNGGDVVEYSSKRDIAVRSGINDVIEIADNLVVENSLTLANGTVIANDPANNSITTAELILDSTRDVGLSSARLRTSVDNLLVRNSAGDIYLQEQNGVNLAEFNANGVFDLRLLNGDLTNSAPLTAADVVRITAENGDVTLAGANQLRDDVAISGNRVELHNASTLTLVEINAEELYLRTQRDIEGDGPITVDGLTDIDAGGDVLVDFATNDFNQLRVTNAVNLTVVDQNAIELLDINASGSVVVRSTNTVTLNDNVTGANGVDVSSGAGSVNQNGTISTNSGSVVVSAGNGEVNLGEDAKIVSNGGSVNINAGAGNVNMGGDTRIAANGGDVNIVAADSVVVAEVVSSGNVNINAGSGSVSDGNGGATNVAAGGLQSSSNTGFGNDDALETNVGNIDITTNTGNVAVSNSGNVTVDKVSTGQGDISLVNQGDVELGGGSVVAENGANGGSVNIDVSQGSVSQSGSTSVPAVKGGGVVVINAPDGAIGEGGGLRVDAPFVEIIAAIKAGDIFVNPGADKIEYFSGSFKFDDQLLAVEPLEDINPAIFANVKSYFFNDISLLLPRDQLYDEDEEE